MGGREGCSIGYQWLVTSIMCPGSVFSMHYVICGEENNVIKKAWGAACGLTTQHGKTEVKNERRDEERPEVAEVVEEDAMDRTSGQRRI